MTRMTRISDLTLTDRTDADVVLICENLRNLWMSLVSQVSHISSFSWTPSGRSKREELRKTHRGLRPQPEGRQKNQRAKKSSSEKQECRFPRIHFSAPDVFAYLSSTQEKD